MHSSRVYTLRIISRLLEREAQKLESPGTDEPVTFLVKEPLALPYDPDHFSTLQEEVEQEVEKILQELNERVIQETE